eukprot:7393293-Pyramimonas_sp.AAC.1
MLSLSRARSTLAPFGRRGRLAGRHPLLGPSRIDAERHLDRGRRARALGAGLQQGGVAGGGKGPQQDGDGA